MVGFRGYAQRDPLSEYKTEAFALFENLLDSLRSDVTQKLSQVRPMTEDEQQAMMQQIAMQQAGSQRPEAAPVTVPVAPEQASKVQKLAGFDESDVSTWGNPSRNDLCPCGSGEKFKHCHGKLA